MKLVMGLALCVSFWSGCSGKSVDENDPASMYADAEDDIKNDRYLLAIEKLRTIKNKFPYSSFSSKAQLRIADVYFLQESYIEAAGAYETFRDLYPKHEEAPYAAYRIAESYALDAPSNIARDLTSAQNAAQSLKEFLKVYPNHARAEDAQKLLSKTLAQLAEKEFYIAEYYFKQKQYVSAKGRYEKLVSAYPESTRANEAKEKITRANLKIAETEAAKAPADTK